MLIGRRLFVGAAAAVAVGTSGCGLSPAAGAVPQLTIVNRTDADAQLRVVEYDFVAGVEGDRIGEPMRPMAPGETTTGAMPIPDAESWALIINDIVAVTSFGLADAATSLDGDGPLIVHVAVEDGALMTSTSRRGGQAGGETSDPVPDP